MKKIIFILIAVILFANNNIVFYNYFEANATQKPKPVKKSHPFIFLNPFYHTSVLNDSFKSLKPKINIAIVINKTIFKRYISSLMNSINTYFLNKEISYNIELFDTKSINKALKKYHNIIIYSLDINQTLIKENNQTNFYFPAINKKDINFSSNNLYLGGLDYKQQIDKLSSFITDTQVVSIISNTLISKKLLLEENSSFNVLIMKYPKINYKELEDKFVFFNTSAPKTAQILSSISNQDITTKLNLTTQINFDPLLIALTQPQDTEKLIIANSILNVPAILEDYNQILNSDIRFNWLNYSTNILLNKIYNLATNEDKFYMNDFDTYIFNNQIEYKTKIYQIIDNSFREVY